MTERKVSYSTYKAICDAHPTWNRFHAASGPLAEDYKITVGHSDRQYISDALIGVDKTNFEANYIGSSTEKPWLDDCLAFLQDLDREEEQRDSSGIPVMAVSPYAYASESTTFQGYKYSAAANAVTIFDEMISDSLVYVQGAEYIWVESPNDGDYMEFSVVDKDDVLGLFATYGLTVGIDVLELKKYAKSFYLPPWSVERHLLAKTAAAVVGGLYIRCYYNNVHATLPVNFGVNYRWYE